jgi:hypothetical protein
MLQALAHYEIEVSVDRLHLLRDRAPGPRRWNPVADAAFEQPLVVGRGGLPIEISVSQLADPEVALRFENEAPDAPSGSDPIVVAARRDNELVAAARGWTLDGQPSFTDVVGDADVERQLLKAAMQSIAGRA